jgi:hypothetical protein
VGADGLFQLLDVLSTSFSESRLSLSVPLFSFLRCRVDLWLLLDPAEGQLKCMQWVVCTGFTRTYRLAAPFPLWLLILLGGGGGGRLSLRARLHGLLAIVFSRVMLIDRHLL